MQTRTAAVAGATGLVGGYLLNGLAQDPLYTHVASITRKPIDLLPPKVEARIVNFDNLESDLGECPGQDFFCALGTTIKVAGSQEAFRRVDFEYPLRLAQWAAQNGFERYFLVSSMGADPHSRIFYSRTKGELEAELAKLTFKSLHIFRPALLMGPRQESRPGEQIAKALMPLLSGIMLGPLRKYRPIHAQDVAQAMIHVAGDKAASGVHVYESDHIQELARTA